MSVGQVQEYVIVKSLMKVEPIVERQTWAQDFTTDLGMGEFFGILHGQGKIIFN
jgi:hypothetical protein